MKDHRVYFDFARAFLPDWLSKVVTSKAFTAVTLALIVLVVVLKVGISIG